MKTKPEYTDFPKSKSTLAITLSKLGVFENPQLIKEQLRMVCIKL